MVQSADLTNQLINYIKKQSNPKKIKGYRSISNPDIAVGTKVVI